MQNSLKIELESVSENDLHKLLKHVCDEIIYGQSYSNIDVEFNSSIDDLKWLVVDGNDIKGKYYWRKL